MRISVIETKYKEYANLLKKANDETQKIVVFYSILLSYVLVCFGFVPLIVVLFNKISGFPYRKPNLPFKAE